MTCDVSVCKGATRCGWTAVQCWSIFTSVVFISQASFSCWYQYVSSPASNNMVISKSVMDEGRIHSGNECQDFTVHLRKTSSVFKEIRLWFSWYQFMLRVKKEERTEMTWCTVMVDRRVSPMLSALVRVVSSCDNYASFQYTSLVMNSINAPSNRVRWLKSRIMWKPVALNNFNSFP